MRLYYGGAEVPGWRNLLAAERVLSVSLSFVGLSRRIKNLGAWSLADKFAIDPGFAQAIFLDSGAYSLNREEGKYGDEEAQTLYDRYMAFVHANRDRIEMFSEFDALQLGPEWRAEMRDELAALVPDKFMPIWHAGDGLDELLQLAERFERIGVIQPPNPELGDLSPVLRRLALRVKLHGVAMTRMAVMKDIPWDSVGSTSWLSPGQYGDTFVWVGGELKRYPVKYRDQARKRHRTLFTDNGFDALAIARDATEDGTAEDRKEVLRLSLWSWGQFVDDITKTRERGVVAGDGVTTAEVSPGDDFAETGDGVVDTTRGRARNGQLVPASREKTLLPVLSVTQAAVNGDGEEEETEPQVSLAQGNLMACNTCFVRDKCPKFEADSECAYEIPMVVTTTTQARALRKLILGMQGQRVLMMRVFEQLEGGYADPNLSAEMRTLQRMLNDDLAADRDHASVRIEVTSDGNSGFMQRMFGRETEVRVNALAEPIDASKMIEASGIVDAEVIESE